MAIEETLHKNSCPLNGFTYEYSYYGDIVIWFIKGSDKKSFQIKTYFHGKEHGITIDIK